MGDWRGKADPGLNVRIVCNELRSKLFHNDRIGRAAHPALYFARLMHTSQGLFTSERIGLFSLLKPVQRDRPVRGPNDLTRPTKQNLRRFHERVPPTETLFHFETIFLLYCEILLYYENFFMRY